MTPDPWRRRGPRRRSPRLWHAGSIGRKGGKGWWMGRGLDRKGRSGSLEEVLGGRMALMAFHFFSFQSHWSRCRVFLVW